MGKKRVINIIKEFIKKVSSDFNVKKVILFGSQARDTNTKNSDIDLMIVSDDFEGMLYFKRVAALYKYWNFKHPVDFICYTNKEFENLKKRISLVSEALREGIIVR